MGDLLAHQDDWQRQAAYGLRHQDLPRMYGTPADGSLLLGADQPDQPFCGPNSGWFWAVSRISVDGLVSGDAVKVYKDTKFVGWISYQPGFATFGIRECVMKSGDFLRIVGTGLTTTSQVEVYGEAISAPGPLMWKLFG
jgi:hypothetical protein